MENLPEEEIIKIESRVFKTYARLAAIFNSSNDAIIGIDADNNITDWNNAAEYIYGYKRAEILGKNIMIICPADTKDSMIELSERVRLKKEAIKNRDMTHVCKNGSLIQVSLTLSPILDDNGEFYGLSIISRDVTEKKIADRKMAQMDEMSRMNRLMTGREIKMAELKGKIKELEEKLAQKR